MLSILYFLCFIFVNIFSFSLNAENAIVDKSVSNSISESLTDQDNIREEIQNLNSQIEDLKSKLDEKDKVEENLKKEILQYKDKDFKKNFADNSEKDLQSLLITPPFNIKNDKNNNYNQGYDALLAKDYISAEKFFTDFIKEDKGVVDNNIQKENILNNNEVKPESKAEDAVVLNEKPEVNYDNIFLSKSNFFMGEIKLLNMNLKESFSYFSESYKLSNDYDVSINSLFKISIIFALQNKNKELCFTLLRIKQTLDLEQNKNYTFYIGRLKSLQDAYPCD